MDIKAIKELVVAAATKKTPANFSKDYSPEDISNALREELSALASDYNTYRRNKLDIFEIIQESIDEIVPNRVLDTIGQFAEIRQFQHGQKASFKVKRGRNRAKRFITRAAASGVYETFRLDSETIDVSGFVLGTGAYIDF